MATRPDPDLLDLLGPIGGDPPETQNAAPIAVGSGVECVEIGGDFTNEHSAAGDKNKATDVVSPLDRPLTLTRFADQFAKQQTRRIVTLRQFAETIATTRAAHKTALPWSKLAQFGDVPKLPGKSLRHDANLGAVEGVEGDYDAGIVSVAEAVARLRAADIAAIVYTTPSHTPDAPRWRVLCPTSAAVTPGERAALCARVNGALGGILAGESFTRSQAYYYGAVGEGEHHTVELTEGRAIDQATEIVGIGKGGAPVDEIADLLGDIPMAPAIDLDDDLDDLWNEIQPDWDRINGALAFVPADDRDEWMRVGMAIHAESRGSEDGFEAWDAWSQGSDKYKARDQQRTWDSFGRRGGKTLGIGSLFDLAKAHGWNAAPVEADDPTTARLNKRHAVVSIRGRTLITTELDDGAIGFGTTGDLHTYYENDRIAISEGKTEPVSRRWMRNLGRRSYPDGVTFAPGGCSAGMLNLWRGWAVEPDPNASCALFLDHVRKVVCRGNADHAAYVIGWLAHMVQRPGEKPGVGLVLRGGKGAGKDTVADYVAQMIGRRHAPTVAEADHVTGKFNARLEAALLLHVQEGLWAGDRKAESTLKYMVTSERVEIERKGIDSINLPSVLRLFISANAEWVVPASADERRWAVFEVSDGRRGDAAYFAALRAEMHGRGPAALLHYLRAYDLKGFNVRAAPETDGLRNQKLASLRNVSAWWFETLNNGALPTDGFDDDDWAAGARTISRGALRGAYVEWMKARRFDGQAVAERQFGKELREMLPGLADTRPTVQGARVWHYTLPALPDCRAAFDTWIGSPVEWEADQ